MCAAHAWVSDSSSSRALLGAVGLGGRAIAGGDFPGVVVGVRAAISAGVVFAAASVALAALTRFVGEPVWPM